MSQTINDFWVSILVCSKDRHEQLRELVNRLKQLPSRYRYEIVVVEETDRPSPIDDVKYIPHPNCNKGIAYARNLAVENASGEIVVFVDDDCDISKRWLDQLVEPFDDEQIVGLQGGVTVPDLTNAVGWAESLLGFPGGGIKRIVRSGGQTLKTMEISTLNCAYRKRVIKEVGGFNECLKKGGEDYRISKQICELGRCLFVPNALVYHTARGGYINIWKWFERRGLAEIELAETGWRKKRFVRYWLRSSMFLKLAVIIAFCMISSSFVLLPLIAACLYFLIQYSVHLETVRLQKIPWSALAVLPLVKLTMDMATDYGRCKGWFTVLRVPKANDG